MRLKGKSVWIFCLILVIGVVTGCSSNAKKDTTEQTSGQQGTENSRFKNGKFDPPVTITTVRSVSAAAAYRDGETIDDNVHTRWMKKNMGIEIKNLWTTPEQNSAYQTKLRLALSSSGDLPDVFLVDDKSLAQDFINSGKVLEVGDLFDKKSGEMWKKSMSEAQDSWPAWGKEGKKYGLPMLNYPPQNAVLWIRQDWLTKLGLDAPKTMDDVEKIAQAFANGDPDGNGKKDTIGLGLAMKNTFKEGIGSGTFIFGAFGTIPDQWNILADGSVGYGSVQPEAKLALAKLADLKAKGLLVADVGLYDSGKLTEAITSGKVGMFSGLNWMPWYPFPDLLKNDPKADFQPFPNPTGPDGKAGVDGFQPSYKALFINKAAKPEVVDAIFAYINKLFEMAYPEVGSEFEHGYYEGYDWATVDGQPTRDTNKIPGGYLDSKKYFMIWDQPDVQSLDLEPVVKRANNEELITPYQKLFKDHPISQMKAGKIAIDQNIAQIDIFSGAPTPTMKSKWAILEKMKLENYSKFVYGERPLEQFDAFVKEWMAAGGDKVTQEVNEWYKSASQK